MLSIDAKDKAVLQQLAREYAEIANLPIQAEKRDLWVKLNGLKAERPMVMIDQICWEEMDNSDGSLTPVCEPGLFRGIEMGLRTNLYRWKHFPVDKVFDNWLNIPMAINDTHFGIKAEDETLATEAGRGVVSHQYTNLFQTDADLDRIKTPVITHDKAWTERRMSLAHEIFDGIIEVRLTGRNPYLSIWDPISTWMSVTDALMAIIDRPDYVHEMMRRLTQGYLTKLDQLEEQGLLAQPVSEIHCTGAYTDELPAEGYDENKPRCKDNWMNTQAQMLGTVGPEMYDEFEIQYSSQICERFGLVYYGCCEPLDKKMHLVRKIPNVRKVSISPWADQANGASEIGTEFVFSSKPNPANLAMSTFDTNLVRRELTEIKKVCDDNDCALEFILKDISTVSHESQRLDQWAKIAMEVVGG